MKRMILLFAITLLISNLKAQTIKIKEPEFVGNIVYANDSIGNGLLLESQNPEIKYKTYQRAFLYTIKGNSSSFIIPQTKDLSFIVKAGSNSVNPSMIIKIFKLKSENSSRTISLKTNLEPDEINRVNFTANKYGESSYLIKISSIEIGEYAIQFSNLFFSFKIKE